MKFNKIILAILAVISVSLFQSCLKEQNDLFKEPNSLRLQAMLDDTKEVLMSAPYGWIFEYYPHKQKKYGGFIYTLKFDEREVNVGFELEPGEFEKSLYNLKGDNGPTLSFDSYNSLMHFFATPWGGGTGEGYQAYDGDFEFALVEVKPSLITLRGKRTGNIMYMRPLEVEASQYLDGVVEVSDNTFLTEATGTVGSAELLADIDIDTRHMTLKSGEISVDQFFVPTATGIRFLEPVNIGDGEIVTLDYDADNMVYSGVTSTGATVYLSGSLPPTYARFEDYVGDFTIKFNSIYMVDVTLVPDKANSRFFVKGINPNYDVIATYKKSAGLIEICSQQVAAEDDKLIWFCMWGVNPSTGSGSITWTTDAGVYITKDPETEGTYNITSNGYA
ncbi:MAG: DUF4302 domain-containing protein, partial [Muribaculaceae bacterium]|nr:DUF4302 domain-containing protein [Muribaculaceae bacterium]